ncbi:MAG: class I SAM-dependent methyltransferase [Solirubrobacterales bacterium]|nr:class I SAM-dependent methyltransferase [Solirubrobacterales bacterium]
MPTLPSSPAPAEPHRARGAAESFGTDPERYERTRPQYPQGLVDRIVAGSPGRDVLDVGIGTGFCARAFRAAGCRVLGVDVDARMAAFAREDGFDVEIARFEDWDPAGRTFDLVIAGMTWHWVDPTAGATKAALLTRPGGRLATFWNIALPPPELARAFSAVYEQVLPDTPFAAMPRDPLAAYERIFIKTADGIRHTGAFGEPQRWQFDWERRYTTDQWVDQVPTFGGHSKLPPAQLDQLLTGIAAAIDASGGSFTTSYAAVVITAIRRLTRPRRSEPRRPW